MTKEQIHEDVIRWMSDVETQMIGRLDGRLLDDPDDKMLEEFRYKLKDMYGGMKTMEQRIRTEGITR